LATKSHCDTVCSYALASVHTFILFARAIQGITVEDKPKGTFLYLADSSRPLSVAAGFIYGTMVRRRPHPIFLLKHFSISHSQLFFSDSFLVWRCFMVWNRNYTVISAPFAMVVVSSSSYGLNFGPKQPQAHILFSKYLDMQQFLKSCEGIPEKLPLNDSLLLP